MEAKYNAKPNPAKRPKGQPLTDDEKATIRRLIAEGKLSHRQICEELGIGTSTLSRFKKQEGLQTPLLNDNTAGTQAFKRDAARKRAERTAALDELFEKRANMLRRVMNGEEKYKTLVKIPGGGEVTEQLSYIPAADWRSEISALAGIGNSIDRADDRNDDGGLARAQSMLANLVGALSGRPIEVPAEQGSFEE